jgi:uncharacterized zinc-type alcohol dehydrogenase-like protein
MLSTQGYAAMTAKTALQSFVFERRDVGPHDVLIAITHYGICHLDIHQARDECGGSISLMVPGHEIVGTIARVGSAVKKFKTNDRVGVGCFVDSCRTCAACREGSEQYCEADVLLTYSGRDKDGQPTQGGYSTQIVVDEHYVLRIPSACRLLEQPHSCARELQHTPRFATGASANIANLWWWDWVD